MPPKIRDVLQQLRDARWQQVSQAAATVSSRVLSTEVA